MVTLAKTLGGGLPSGAIGGTEEVMRGRRGRQRLPGRHLQRQPAVDGRRAREPRAGAHARGLPPPRRAQRPHRRRLRGRDRAPPAARATRSASARRAASRSRPTPIVDYETFKANQDVAVTELAWLWNMNRGIYMTPGPRGGVDAVGDPHRRGDRRLRAGVRRDGGRADGVSARARCGRRSQLRRVGPVLVRDRVVGAQEGVPGHVRAVAARRRRAARAPRPGCGSGAAPAPQHTPR